MKSKKGFMSISIVYSFLILFLLLMFSIVVSYSNRVNMISSLVGESRAILKKVEKEVNLGREMVDVILETNPVVTSGDGLWNLEGERIFRGSNPNNFVLFNDTLWRIIKLHPDNTIRISAINEVTTPGAGWRLGGTPGDNKINFKDSPLDIWLNETYYNDTVNGLKGKYKNYLVEKPFDLSELVGMQNTTLPIYNFSTYTTKVQIFDIREVVMSSLNYVSGSNNTLNTNALNYIIETKPSNSISLTLNNHAGFYYAERTNYSSIFFKNDSYPPQFLSAVSRAVYETGYPIPVVTLGTHVKMSGGNGTQLEPYILVCPSC